jgi:hypothetical protein
MKTKYRIVRDKWAGYEAQFKPWYCPTVELEAILPDEPNENISKHLGKYIEVYDSIDQTRGTGRLYRSDEFYADFVALTMIPKGNR